MQQFSTGIDLITDKRYDAQDRQIAIAHSKQTTSAKTLIAGQAITRGAGGAVSRIDTFDASASFDSATGSFSGNPSRVQAFGYDANARLVQESEYKASELAVWLLDSSMPATKATTYGYDQVGNRNSKTVVTTAGTQTTSYSYDDNDRLISETRVTPTGSSVVTSYTWDGNGNLQSKTTPSEYTGYTFDADNRLIEIKRGQTQATATSVAKYGYDADGQRIRKTTPTDTTHFLIDPTTTWPQVVLEKTGSQHTAYVWADALRQQAKGAQGTTATTPTEDLAPLIGHLGTTIAAIDKSGNVVERYEASAFGELQNQAPKAKHQYTGEYWDPEAKLTYLRARWYQSEAFRLLSVDPAAGRVSDPRALNRYAYAHSDPLNVTDPSGKESLMSLSTALNVTAASVSFAGGFVAGSAADVQSHVYAVDSTICNTSMRGYVECTKDVVFQELRYQPAPGPRRHTPASTGSTSFAFPVGRVRHTVGDYVVINKTIPWQHLLHHGVVERKVVSQGNVIHIQSNGYGTGGFATLNEILADALWHSVDRRIAEELGFGN